MKSTNPFVLWRQRRLKGGIKGCLVEGDKNVDSTPTNPFSFWRVFRTWNTVAIFKVTNIPEEVYIGFENFRNQVIVRGTPIKDEVFGVRIGREKCVFFVVDSAGKEVPLQLVKRTTRSDPQYGDIPLY